MSDGLIIQNVLATSSVPFYSLLSGHYRKWIPLYLVSQEKRPLLQDLEKQRLQLNNLAGPLDDFLSWLKGHFSELQQRRDTMLSVHLQGFRSPTVRDRNPFEVEHFVANMGRLTDAFFPFGWPGIERVVQSMPAGLSDRDRRKKEEQLDRSIAELKAELDSTNLPGRFVMSRARVLADSWQVLVSHWVSLQGKLVDPCGPRGLTLTACDPDEQWAWNELGLKEHVNSRGRFRANPGGGS